MNYELVDQEKDEKHAETQTPKTNPASFTINIQANPGQNLEETNCEGQVRDITTFCMSLKSVQMLHHRFDICMAFHQCASSCECIKNQGA